MSRRATGLERVPTDRLRALLSVLYAGRIELPLSLPRLMLAGFSDIADDLRILYGLDEAGVRVALVVTLAERAARPRD